MEFFAFPCKIIMSGKEPFDFVTRLGIMTKARAIARQKVLALAASDIQVEQIMSALSGKFLCDTLQGNLCNFSLDT